MEPLLMQQKVNNIPVKLKGRKSWWDYCWF